ncbi:hypothetical protein KPH14_010366 [Odynerus spinipes]|uniref:Uncharacterized protein n=1 Tax=Odynerus spinipes TaxID=1348599 RepID=A0AAD9RTQ4_9HYME|nr:hypothetical protein KPH14_010366 [Odynerus spinipes]
MIALKSGKVGGAGIQGEMEEEKSKRRQDARESSYRHPPAQGKGLIRLIRAQPRSGPPPCFWVISETRYTPVLANTVPSSLGIGIIMVILDFGLSTRTPRD